MRFRFLPPNGKMAPWKKLTQDILERRLWRSVNGPVLLAQSEDDDQSSRIITDKKTDFVGFQRSFIGSPQEPTRQSFGLRL